MSDRNGRRGKGRQYVGLYVVRYWNAAWEELDHLRIEHACMLDVGNAMTKWFVERNRLRTDSAALSVMQDACMLTVEEEHTNG